MTGKRTLLRTRAAASAVMAACLAFPAAAEEGYWTSQECILPAWRRIIATAPLEAGGHGLQAWAAGAAQARTNSLAAASAEAASNRIETAMRDIPALTNDIRDRTEFWSLAVRAAAPANLTAWVDEESTDGTNDFFTVRFSQLLATPPLRSVRYVSPAGTNWAECTWIGSWDAATNAHPCRCARPAALRGAAAVFSTARADRMGGPGGFNFGGRAVRVDGSPGITGSFTNGQAVIEFRDGVFTKLADERQEEEGGAE